MFTFGLGSCCLGLGDLTLAGHPISLRVEEVPAKVSLDSEVIELTVGAFHAIARLRNGELRVWGDNGQGQLGVGALHTPRAFATSLPWSLFT